MYLLSGVKKRKKRNRTILSAHCGFSSELKVGKKREKKSTKLQISDVGNALLQAIRLVTPRLTRSLFAEDS